MTPQTDVRRARVHYEGHLSSHRWRYFVPEPGTYWAGMHGGAPTWRIAMDRACAQIREYSSGQQAERMWPCDPADVW